MDKEIKTGGPAFPFSVMTYQPDHPESPRYTTTWHGGMTLRDYFAAKAMQGYLPWQSLVGGDALLKSSDTAQEWINKTAVAAYEMADAMLKAREQ